jgi:uncharacterized membrane protein
VATSSRVLARRSPASDPSTPQRPSTGFLALVGLVIVGAVVVRLALLDRQSYWIDELFSVNESAGSPRAMLRVGSTEVHTPFYAALLWAWMKVGGTHEVWTRLFSTLCTVAAIVVTHRGLRDVRLGEHIRWALTVATAASGVSIIYALETRNYALLILGSVGLTVITLRAALVILDGGDLPRGIYLSWAGWAALAATAHLFGAILTLGAMSVLAVLTMYRGPGARIRRVLSWVALAAAGCSLQAAWLLDGLTRPGFASGTDWIRAPDRRAVWELVTTTFGSGDLVTHKDGFAWTSPIGVIMVAAVWLAAVLARSWTTRRRTVPVPVPGVKPAAWSAQGRAAAVLLVLATVVIVPVFGISQWKHLWTLRNMVIVSPALLWGVICLAAAAAGTATGRRRVATVVVALLGLSLVPVTIGLSHPYKTDFRGLLEYLIAVRAEKPDASYVFLGRDAPWDWRTASDRPDDDPAWDTLYRQVTRYRRATSYPVTPRKTAGTSNTAGMSNTEIVIFYHGVANPHLDDEAAELLGRLDPGSCRRIPIYALIVIRCH